MRSFDTTMLALGIVFYLGATTAIPLPVVGTIISVSFIVLVRRRLPWVDFKAFTDGMLLIYMVRVFPALLLMIPEILGIVYLATPELLPALLLIPDPIRTIVLGSVVMLPAVCEVAMIRRAARTP